MLAREWEALEGSGSHVRLNKHFIHAESLQKQLAADYQ